MGQNKILFNFAELIHLIMYIILFGIILIHLKLLKNYDQLLRKYIFICIYIPNKKTQRFRFILVCCFFFVFVRFFVVVFPECELIYCTVRLL
jgi:hypothetical protein